MIPSVSTSVGSVKTKVAANMPVKRRLAPFTAVCARDPGEVVQPRLLQSMSCETGGPHGSLPDRIVAIVVQAQRTRARSPGRLFLAAQVGLDLGKRRRGSNQSGTEYSLQ